MKNLIYVLLFALISSHTVCKAQTGKGDTLASELNKIKQTNALLRIKDSIRAELLKEQFYNLNNPKSAEVEKYKSELIGIRLKDSLRLNDQKKAIDAIRRKVRPISVQPFYKTLFNIYSDLGPFSAQQRAAIAQQNILDIYELKNYVADSIKTERKQDYSNILYKGKVVTSIGEEDALWGNTTRDLMTEKYVQLIKNSIQKNRENYAIENVVHRWLLTAGIIFAFFMLYYLIRRAVKWLVKIMLHKKSIRENGLKIKSYQFLSPGKVRLLIVKMLGLVHSVIFMLLLYISLSFIFSFFPATENWANRLLNWLWQPLKDFGVSFYHYLPKLFKILIILVVGRFVNRVIRYFSIEIKRGNLHIKGFYKDWATPTYKLVRLCLIALTIIIVFPLLPGSETNAFKGISVFFGVLISLGSSSAISNIIAGFIITYMRSFKEGDWIKINDVTGEVIEKTALITRLRTINNEEITVPNSMILSNKTTNYCSPGPERMLILSTVINVNYNISWETVNELLQKAAHSTTDLEKEPSSFIFKNKIDETYVSYQLNAYTKKPDRMYFILSDLNENILKTFKERGIDLLSPRYYPKPQTD